MNGRISVIVRARNEEKTIGRALRLLQEQTVRPAEIIVVDNASTDRTKEIAASFGCIVLDISDDEFDHATSCNRGAARSTGEFLVFTNGHSFPINSRWLETGLRHFDDPTVAGVYSLPLVDGRASFWEAWVDRTRNGVFGDADLRVIDRFSVFIGLGLMNTASCMLRRALWEEHPYDRWLGSVGGGEDSEWGFHYLRRGYRIVEDGKFAVYHCHGDSLPRYLVRVYFYYLTYLLAYLKNRFPRLFPPCPDA